MPRHAQQSANSCSHIYPMTDDALQSSPATQQDTLALNNHNFTQSPTPFHGHPPTLHQPKQYSEAPITHYQEFSIPYQSNIRNGSQGYGSPVATRVHSPPDIKGSFDQPKRSSVSELSDRRRSNASTGARRPSISSMEQGVRPQPNGSARSSEVTSPSSSRGIGAHGSDESIQQSGNADSKDGSSGTPVNAKKEDPPPWSELKTKAGKERKRLPLACIACRRKKIRCSGEKPACKHCLRSRIPCVYRVTTRKAAPRTDYMAMLDKRLKRMEERVIKIIPAQDLAKLAHIGRANVRPSLPQAPKTSCSKKRPADEAFNHDELDEWVQAGPGRGLGHTRQSSGIDQSEQRLLTEGAESLPSKDIQEHLSEVFFDCLYGQSYHVLHKPSFMRRLRAGIVPPVLILAVCAIAARFSTHPHLNTEPAFLRGESWAKPAREIALRRYDEPNITILTVLLILGLHEFGTCQGGRSWMLGGMAVRMAYALQLHRELDHDPLVRKRDKSSELSLTDREIRRRTMWACFLMDRFNSSGTERPPFANEDAIEVQLPIKESHFQLEIPGPTENLDGGVPNPVTPDAGQVSDPKENMGVAAYLIRIIALWGRVIKYLNLGGKFKDPFPIHHPDSQFATLKKHAHEYLASLPESLQYNTENLQNHAAEKLANQFLFLHVTYHQVILFLHKFAVPASSDGNLSNDMSKEFLSEAAHTAIEAASQISSILRETANHLVAAPFVGYCAFVSSTVHIWGIFSKNPKLEASSKRNLGYNVKYLSMMKKYWGMFHYMAENLKDIYRQHQDAARKGSIPPEAVIKKEGAIFQYGDWFNKYPHGVSGTDYEDPAIEIKKESGNDAALSQKSDLQSVEEFFTTLSPAPPARAENQRKATKRHPKGTVHQTTLQSVIVAKNGVPVSHQQMQAHNQALLSMPMHQTHHRYSIDDALYSQSLYPSHHSLPLQYQSPMTSLHQSHHLPDSFGGYSGAPSLDSLTGDTPNENIGSLWDTQMDFSQLGSAIMGTGYGDISSSAWFMPFNLHPPDVGADGEFINLTGYEVDVDADGI